MESERFDSVVRSLSSGAARRTFLGALVGGALGLAGLVESGAKKGKGKGKKKKKGDKCTKVRSKCAGGKCFFGDACCSEFDCDSCSNLSCVKGTPGVCECLPGEIFHNGRCGLFPTCLSAGEVRPFDGIRCCSGIQHTEGPNEAPFDVCDPGVLSCLADSDCTGQPCRGFSCEAPELACIAIPK